MVEKYASLIEKSVVSDDDCKFQESIDNECFNILKKLPNYQEYLQLPEYQFVLGLLRKGIAPSSFRCCTNFTRNGRIVIFQRIY